MANPLPISPETSAGPKKETARITLLPDPPAKPAATVQMKKTQPLVTMPDPNVERAPITVAPLTTPEIVDLVPMSLCWSVLGGAALILLIQIWNYVA